VRQGCRAILAISYPNNHPRTSHELSMVSSEFRWINRVDRNITRASSRDYQRLARSETYGIALKFPYAEGFLRWQCQEHNQSQYPDCDSLKFRGVVFPEFATFQPMPLLNLAVPDHSRIVLKTPSILMILGNLLPGRGLFTSSAHSNTILPLITSPLR
jgi:hypothetical protein